MIQYQKIIISSDSLINIGLVSLTKNYVTDYGYKWLKVHSTSPLQIFTNPYTIYK
jgi:hypothetical protein